MEDSAFRASRPSPHLLTDKALLVRRTGELSGRYRSIVPRGRNKGFTQPPLVLDQEQGPGCGQRGIQWLATARGTVRIITSLVPTPVGELSEVFLDEHCQCFTVETG